MIRYQLKLKPTKTQVKEMERYLFHLASIWNWAIRKIELDAKDKIYHSKFDFQNLLANHSQKIGVPSHIIQGILKTAHESWVSCFKRLSGKPKFKSRRNKLKSIPLIDAITAPSNNKIWVVGVGKVKYYKQTLPKGRIKCGRVLKRTSGWYLSIIIDAEPKPVPIVGYGQVGIDPGFKSLLTLSNGEKVPHPREHEVLQKRLGQAQRGNNHNLSSRLQEQISNQRRDRNHKLSRRLVSQNELVVFSKDNHQKIAKKFGKSVSSSGHSQLRRMLAYKCRIGGRQYVEVDPKFSTKTCSDCGCFSGPSGLAGLKVRQWECADCGSLHDRDVNAAINTLKAGAGLAHEMAVEASLESQELLRVSNSKAISKSLRN